MPPLVRVALLGAGFVGGLSSCSDRGVTHPEDPDAPRANLRGEVVWPGGPVASARVYTAGGLEAWTDSLGNFGLDVAPGSHTLWVAPSSDSIQLPPMVGEARVPSEGFAEITFRFGMMVVELPPASSFPDSLLVLDLSSEAVGLLGSVLVTGHTTEGELEFGPLAPGGYVAELFAERPAERLLHFAAGVRIDELERSTVRLGDPPAGSNVRGAVTWPGGRVPGATVRESQGGSECVTDALGRFFFTLDPGEVELRLASAPGAPWFYGASKQIEVPEEGEVETEFRLARLRVEISAPPELEDSVVTVGRNVDQEFYQDVPSIVTAGRVVVEMGPLPARWHRLRLQIGSDPDPYDWDFTLVELEEAEDLRLAHSIPRAARLDVEFEPGWEGFLAADATFQVGNRRLWLRPGGEGATRAWSRTRYESFGGVLELEGQVLANGERFELEPGDFRRRNLSLGGIRVDMKQPPGNSADFCFVRLHGPDGSRPAQRAVHPVYFLDLTPGEYRIEAFPQSDYGFPTWFRQWYPGTDREEGALSFTIGASTDQLTVPFELTDGGALRFLLIYEEPGTNSPVELQLEDLGGVVRQIGTIYREFGSVSQIAPGPYRVVVAQESTGQRIYYPGTLDPELATTVEIRPGERVELEMILHRPFLPNAGGCCVDADCSWLGREECFLAAGVFAGFGLECDEFRCDDIPLACCLRSGECRLLTTTACAEVNGQSIADEVCHPSPCHPVGACCLDDGCEVMREWDCHQLLGRFTGDYIACDPAPCGDPVGACCEDGVCLVVRRALCESSSRARYMGDFVACEFGPCP